MYEHVLRSEKKIIKLTKWRRFLDGELHTESAEKFDGDRISCPIQPITYRNTKEIEICFEFYTTCAP